MGICFMSPPNFKRIRSKMSERLITLALACSHTHAVIEHDMYVSHVCVLGVRACVIERSWTDHICMYACVRVCVRGCGCVCVAGGGVLGVRACVIERSWTDHVCM
jgi:hypothetical protein